MTILGFNPVLKSVYYNGSYSASRPMMQVNLALFKQL